MTHFKWFPAAAVSVLVLACGGSADNKTRAGTGGTTSIDTGVPTNASGGIPVSNGLVSGGAANCNGNCIGGAYSTGTDGRESTGGAVGTGGTFARLLPICTPGSDQTCNDIPITSAIMGHCETDTTCTCINPYVINYTTGKCNTYDQTVCYSPTQNIDKAYVDRAFGCTCDSSTSIPFCGIDSSGLLVYLTCTSDHWQSGLTALCADPKDCYSPTQNAASALDADAVSCSCDSSIGEQRVELAADAGVFTGGDAGVTRCHVSALTFYCMSNAKWGYFTENSCCDC